jgi:S1-C subfamily serine protease
VNLRGDLVGINTAFFADGRALLARRVGADPETDVAVIQVRAGGLTELPSGDSDRLEVGDFVFAVGRSNPGMGFAIPINMARSLADQMLEFGNIRRGALGFTYDDFPFVLPRELGLSIPPPGAVVLAVAPRSAAERAGLKPGDLVKELGGTPVRDAADLQIRLALLRTGEVAEFAVSRPDGTVTVRAAMAEREPAARSKSSRRLPHFSSWPGFVPAMTILGYCASPTRSFPGRALLRANPEPR